MMWLLRQGRQVFQVVRAGDAADDVVWFRSVDDARGLVSRLANDESNLSVIRAAMRSESLGLDAHRLSDEQVTEQFSRQLVHGRLRLAAGATQSQQQASVVTTEKTAQEETPPPSQKPTRQKTWIKFKVIDDANGRPLSGVRLRVTHPDGEENYYTTVGSGLIEIRDIDPGDGGEFEVTCDLKDARLVDTLHFVDMGDKSFVEDGTPAPGGSSLKQIAEIEAHKVQTDESIDSLARGAGMKWQDLAKFNWGTDVPEKINTHLRDDVGCTKKTADGKNYMFDDTDEPGIVFIPLKWSQAGLPTEEIHVIRVRGPRLLKVDKAWLGVQVFFHKTPIEGLAVEFFRAESDDSAGEKVGGTHQTDPDGLARFDGKVEVGNYICRIENQPNAHITTVSDEKEATVLVLPIGRPFFEYDAVKDGTKQQEVGPPKAPEA